MVRSGEVVEISCPGAGEFNAREIVRIKPRNVFIG
jgi:hypothetical protein